jgi:hypothetical protein
VTEPVRKLIESIVPWLIENRWPRRATYVAFWTTTVFMTYLFVATNPVYGLVVMGFPLSLLAATRRSGLANLNLIVIGIAVTPALVPAFFLGKYQSTQNELTGLPLVGYFGFLLWVTMYPLMLDIFDHRYHLSLFPADEAPPALPKAARDTEAMRRLLFVKLSMATVVMLVVGGTYVVVASVVGLLFRRYWTAAVATAASLLGGFFSEQEFAWEFDPLAILAGVIAAELWYQAYKNPLWDARTRRVVLR